MDVYRTLSAFRAIKRTNLKRNPKRLNFALIVNIYNVNFMKMKIEFLHAHSPPSLDAITMKDVATYHARDRCIFGDILQTNIADYGHFNLVTKKAVNSNYCIQMRCFIKHHPISTVV